MKPLLTALILFSTILIGHAQDSISSRSGSSKARPLLQKLIQGYWVNVKDTTIHLWFTKDSLFVRDRKLHEAGNTAYYTEKYAYDAEYHISNDVPPAGNPALKKWGGYYIQAWDDSGEPENFWTFAVYSVSARYLRIEENGQDVYKRIR